jgi:hypothetical protein
MYASYRQNKIGVLLSLGMLLAAWLYYALPVHAAAGRLYLKTDSLNVNTGETVTVGIRVDTGGDLINSVQANLTYPADRLEYVGASSEGTAFPVQAEEVGGSGKVAIARGSIPKVSGDQLVATVRFRVKAGSGRAVIAIGPGSAMVRSSDNANILTSNGNLTLQLAAKASANNDTVGPQIDNIKVEKGSNRRVTVSWTTNEPATSQVEFGVDRYYLSVQSSRMETSHKLVLPAEMLEPSATYKLKATSVDANSNVAVSQEVLFEAPGLAMTLKFFGEDGRPLVGAVVSLGGHSHRVGADGTVTFDDLAAGDQQAKVRVGKKVVDVPVRVEPVARSNSQEQSVQVAGVTAQKTGWQSAALVMILLAGLAAMLMRRQQLIELLKQIL